MNAQTRIRELAEVHLAPNRTFEGVQFIDQLLGMASEIGAIRCTFAGERRLRFQIADQPAWEVEFDRAEAKLRMLCARLGVLCNETGNQDVSLYGGEGVIEKRVPAFSSSAHAPAPSRGTSDHKGIILDDVLEEGPTLSQVVRTSRLTVRFMNTPGEHWFVITAS